MEDHLSEDPVRASEASLPVVCLCVLYNDQHFKNVFSDVPVITNCFCEHTTEQRRKYRRSPIPGVSVSAGCVWNVSSADMRGHL